ncbi:hypothetical protein BG28_06555 [Nesterenkonia sp. AN1]|uniref:hypothetical protein n=1 Tax=Nesterenkonia sp. AN1 TaxID=652017 RepID=UPI000451621A|nr:hypothetical protein [Nesterenkonia sp. AN1]EXF24373.1 hypothetical protein BG28_06555 [Nesterenkonia sp. AN1]
MAHTETHKLLQITYTCDTKGCTAGFSGDVVQAGSRIEAEDFDGSNRRAERDARTRMRAHFHTAGWALWSGRGQRHYCPQHGPRPGHTMHQVTAEEDIAAS